MKNSEEQYLEILQELLDHGVVKDNRTGTNTRSLFSRSIRHNMGQGVPLLTTKRVAKKTAMVELEGFIKGITSKQWFQDRGCDIWSEWANPQKVPYGNDSETQKKMREEDDLGSCIYGASWRGFHDPEATGWDGGAREFDSLLGQEIDQLQNIVNTLKENPNDRRMVCMAWNPLGLNHTALPPCHMGFVMNVLDGKLNLEWWQRSADWLLGVPFNLFSYGTLLHLLAKESGLEEGELVGNFVDVHLYENHIDQAKEQLSRNIVDGRIKYNTNNFTSIFDWKHSDTEILNYHPHPSIKAPVAI